MTLLSTTAMILWVVLCIVFAPRTEPQWMMAARVLLLLVVGALIIVLPTILSFY